MCSPSSIHPRYKRQISERLALGAFALAYGLEETTGRYQGPFPTSITQDGGDVVVEFDDGQAELEFRDTEGFEVSEPCFKNAFQNRGLDRFLVSRNVTI